MMNNKQFFKMCKVNNINIHTRPIEAIAEELIEICMRGYDSNADYIEDLFEWRQAKARNEEIMQQVADIKQFVADYKNNNKEDIPMSTTVKENKTNLKEETKMKKTNVHAENYVRKEDIRKELESLGIKLSNTEFKKTRRDDMLKMLEKAKAQQPTITDTEVTPVQEPSARREKYNLFCHLVKTNALENQKKGYGHVVSAYMLCAHILKADYGLEKLKGHEHEVTPEQRAKVKEIRNFMINKGHIKAVTWSYNNVTYYLSEYDGNNKNFMVPVEKAPKDAKLAVTTYKVMW